MRRRLAVAAGLGTSALTLAYSLWDADLAALWEILRGMRAWTVGPFLGLLLAFFLLNARRWALMLRPFGCFSLAQVLPAMMIGFAGNNVLPLRLGELVRTVVFAAGSGQSRSGILATLVAERLLDLLAILIVFLLGLALLRQSAGVLQAGAWVAAAALSGTAAAVLLLVGWPERIAALYAHATRSLPEAPAARGACYLAQFQRGLAFLREPRLAGEALILSLGRWLLAVALVWLSVKAYGEDIPVALAMVVVGVTAFAVSLPSAPGFVGPIQAAFVLTLTPAGLPQEKALAASIFFLAGHWLPVTAVGLAYFVGHHHGYRQIQREAQALADG